MFGVSKEYVERMKKDFPRGTKVVCDFMNDPYHPVSTGTIGIVDCVDDMGTVFVNWETGSSLGLTEEDRFHIVK